MTTTILPTRNTDWGFWGTIARIETIPAADPTKAWEIASRRIAETTNASPEGVREFLDSRHGRHFADDVANGSARASPRRRDRRRHRPLDGLADRSQDQPRRGHPGGLPYLTGWVAHFGILDEMQA